MSFWKRFLVGTLLIVVATAAASATAAFNELDKIVTALREGGQLELGTELVEAGTGDPQTIMLIGSDIPTPGTEGTEAPGGSGGEGEARSDTVILVRLDPAEGATALMSLPRDLKVNIPGHGTDRLNAAYSLGGPKLTLETVKELTGLQINHVINIDFGGFQQAVDRLGCVYTDVDRDYFSPGLEYAYINLNPGYQKLCGRDALSYVRFRHEDTDLVRSARQQDFLRQAKQQISVSRLISDRDDLIKIFGQYTDSDLNSRSSALRLLKLVVSSANQPFREVHFEAEIGESFVTASDETVKKLAQEFLGVEEGEGPRAPAPPDIGEQAKAVNKPDGFGSDGGSDDKQKRAKLEDASVDGLAQAELVESQGARLPVFYPRLRTPGSVFEPEPNAYRIPVEGQGKQPAYRMVISTGGIGEYYGVQGTTWKNPPILDDPTETRTAGGRRFELHYDGDRLRLVAWRTKDAVYWISNTLTQSLSAKEMLEIAASTREL